MSVPARDAMTREERRAGMGLAAIFALRMLGLFLILPVFAVHAATTLPSTNSTRPKTITGLRPKRSEAAP